MQPERKTAMTNLKNIARDYWLAQIELCGEGFAAWMNLRSTLCDETTFAATNDVQAHLDILLPDTYAPEKVETLCRRGAWVMAQRERDFGIYMDWRREMAAESARAYANAPYTVRYATQFDFA